MQTKDRKKIKLFLFDLEGVLVPKNVSNDAPLLEKSILAIIKFFNMLNSLGFYCGIVTLRGEDALIGQLKKIPQCSIITSTFDKLTPAEELLTQKGLSFENLFYMGDDMFDIPLLSKAGFSAAPSNAHKEAKRVVDLVIPYAIVEDLFSYIIKEIIEKNDV